MSNIRSGVLLGLAVMLTAAGGCTSTQVFRMARFSPGQAVSEILDPAPKSAAYRVKYALADAKRLLPLPGAKRIVSEGDPLGFVTAPDGGVVAVAGPERIPLSNLPPSTRYCVWTTTDRRETQFTREMGKALATGIAVTADAAVIASEAYAKTHGLDDDDDGDDDCVDDSGRNPRHHHDHDHHEHHHHHHDHQPHPNRP